MKKIVIIPNPKKDSGFAVTLKVIDLLLSHGACVYIEDKYQINRDGVLAYTEFPDNIELVLVVGGDGSVLDASINAIEKDIPMLGVNLGKIGYLSEVEPEGLEILSRLFSNEYTVEEKMLLSVSLIKGDEVVRCSRLAVNDVIISHNSFLGIADFILENGSLERVKYRADGIILSTPAGSTAYSLSAGGPIISHGIDSIIATPICPHSFFDRSIIFRANEKLFVKNAGENDLHISVDGRYFSNISEGEGCSVEMSDKKVKMITFNENSMFATLFKKMKLIEKIV